MKDFIARLQKDLSRLQTTIEKEGDDLIKKVRTLTDKKKIEKTRHEIEAIVSKKLQSFEPALKKFVTAIEQNAAKAGIDVKAVEKKVRTTANKAKAKIAKTNAVKSRPAAKSKSTSTKAKAPAKTATSTAKTATKAGSSSKTKAPAKSSGSGTN